MPTYDYLCLKCAHKFEAFQGIKENPLKKCPKCKGKVQRQISIGGGFIFKGSGFYATDYKKSAPKGPEQNPVDSKKDTSKEFAKESPKESPKKKD